MVKRTVELYSCDVCGKDAKRYTVTYEDDGTRVTDRCEKHGARLEALKDEPGEWLSERSKSTFRKSTPADIRLALARSNSSQK